MSAAKQVAAVVTYHALDGEPVRVYEDPVEAQAAVDKQQDSACCTGAVRATSFRSAQRISQILKQNLFPKGHTTGTMVRGYHHTYAGYVVESGGIYGGFVSVSWLLGDEPIHERSTNEQAVAKINGRLDRMAYVLRQQGFVVVRVPARVRRGGGLTTGGLWVIGKEVTA